MSSPDPGSVFGKEDKGMTDPRYTEDELWERLRAIWNCGATYHSLVQKRKYVMLSLNELKKNCTFRFESGHPKAIPFDDLYAIYTELYARGDLPRDFLRNSENSLRVMGRKSWHSPGAAMYALLPLLDDAIKIVGRGHLFL